MEILKWAFGPQPEARFLSSVPTLSAKFRAEIYTIGPIVGAVLAALAYRYFIESPNE